MRPAVKSVVAIRAINRNFKDMAVTFDRDIVEIARPDILGILGFYVSHSILHFPAAQSGSHVDFCSAVMWQEGSPPPPTSQRPISAVPS